MYRPSKPLASLSDTESISKKFQLTSILEKTPKLKRLTIGNMELDENLLTALSIYCVELETLTIQNCLYNVNHENFQNSLQKLKHLKSLTLDRLYGDEEVEIFLEINPDADKKTSPRSVKVNNLALTEISDSSADESTKGNFHLPIGFLATLYDQCPKLEIHTKNLRLSKDALDFITHKNAQQKKLGMKTKKKPKKRKAKSRIKKSSNSRKFRTKSYQIKKKKNSGKGKEKVVAEWETRQSTRSGEDLNQLKKSERIKRTQQLRLPEEVTESLILLQNQARALPNDLFIPGNVLARRQSSPGKLRRKTKKQTNKKKRNKQSRKRSSSTPRKKGEAKVTFRLEKKKKK